MVSVAGSGVTCWQHAIQSWAASARQAFPCCQRAQDHLVKHLTEVAEGILCRVAGVSGRPAIHRFPARCPASEIMAWVYERFVWAQASGDKTELPTKWPNAYARGGSVRSSRRTNPWMEPLRRSAPLMIISSLELSVADWGSAPTSNRKFLLRTCCRLTSLIRRGDPDMFRTGRSACSPGPNWLRQPQQLSSKEAVGSGLMETASAMEVVRDSDLPMGGGPSLPSVEDLMSNTGPCYKASH